MSASVLLVRLSSLGDVVHAFPAVADAAEAWPGLRIDWLVDAAFADLPALHPAVHRVLPVPLRRLKGRGPAALPGLLRAVGALRARRYERIVDVQGLLKSALLARVPRGVRVGPDRWSAREPLAARLYARTRAVPRDLHAVERVRRLVAGALGVPGPPGPPRSGLEHLWSPGSGPDRVLLLHGTTWATKHWPDAAWKDLARRLRDTGRVPVTTWGDAAERTRAEALGREVGVEVVPRLRIRELVEVIRTCRATVAVDTGLAHLSAALGVPTLALHGPTDPCRTGVVGPRASVLASGYHCAPCLQRSCKEDPDRQCTPWPPCLGAVSMDDAWTELQRWLMPDSEP